VIRDEIMREAGVASAFDAPPQTSVSAYTEA
jgi:hypothetical protein